MSHWFDRFSSDVLLKHSETGNELNSYHQKTTDLVWAPNETTWLKLDCIEAPTANKHPQSIQNPIDSWSLVLFVCFVWFRVAWLWAATSLWQGTHRPIKERFLCLACHVQHRRHPSHIFTRSRTQWKFKGQSNQIADFLILCSTFYLFQHFIIWLHLHTFPCYYNFITSTTSSAFCSLRRLSLGSL